MNLEFLWFESETCRKDTIYWHNFYRHASRLSHVRKRLCDLLFHCYDASLKWSLFPLAGRLGCICNVTYESNCRYAIIYFVFISYLEKSSSDVKNFNYEVNALQLLLNQSNRINYTVYLKFDCKKLIHGLRIGVVLDIA